MPIASGDVWAFALEQKLFGQQIINTFAMKLGAVPVNDSIEAFLNSIFGNNDDSLNAEGDLRDTIRALQSDQVTHVGWLVKRLLPVETATFVIGLTERLTGAIASDCETANVAMAIGRKGELPGRRHRGRIAIAGIPTTSYAAGVFNAAAVAAGNLVGAQMSGFRNRAGQAQYNHGFVVPSRKNPNPALPRSTPRFEEVVAFKAQSTVRVQRSRTVGVGS